MSDTPGKRVVRVRRSPTTGRATAKVTVEGRYAEFLAGELSVDDLTDEEILRGRLMDKNGGWTGRPPKVVPDTFLQAIRDERPKRIQAMLDKEIPHAFKALHDVMVGGTANKGGGAKVAAATKILEYAIGKPSEQMKLTVETSQAAKWENMLPEIFHALPSDTTEDVVDAEEEE